VTVSRLAVAILAAVSLLCAAPPAYACQFPNLSLLAPSAGPGEQVGFTISEVDQGARWDVYLEGQWVAGDISDGRPVRGSFPMHDLGSTSYTATVSAQVDHDDGPNQPPLGRLEYRAPAPPAELGPQQSTSPVTPAEPAPSTTEAEQPARAPAKPGRQPDGGRSQPVRTHRSPSRPHEPSAHVQKPRRAAPQLEQRSRSTALDEYRATGRAVTDEVARGDRTRAVAGRRAAEARAERPAQGPRRAAIPAPLAPAQPLEARPTGPATVPVGVAVLVLLVATTAAVLYVARRRRPGLGAEPDDTSPPWIPPEVALEARARDVLIEAELQEIVAEERLKRLDRGQRTDVPG
jgi:hypothetical protein